MNPQFLSETQIVTGTGNSWLIAGLRETFAAKGVESAIEAFAKAESFTQACVYPKDGKIVGVFSNSIEPRSYYVAENFARYAAKTNGSKNAICIEEYSKDQWLLIVVVDGEIAIEQKCTKLVVLSKIADVLRTKNERDSYMVGINGAAAEKFVFSLYCYGMSSSDYSIETSDLFTSLQFLCDIDDLRQHISDRSIFETLEQEPHYKNDRIRIALTHIRDERVEEPFNPVPIVIFLIVLVVGYFGFFYESKKEEVKINPYEPYYTAVKTKYLNVYPRLASDYNILVMLEREVQNWDVSTVVLDKGFTSFRMVPARSEAKVAELRAFTDKHNFVFDGDNLGYSILANVNNFAVFGKDYRKIYSVADVHQYLDDAFITGIPATQLTLLKDVPNGQAPYMSWVVRELTLNVTAMPYEDLLAIGGILIQPDGSALPVTIGGDDVSGTSIGTLTVDPKKRLVTGALTMSVFGKRN